MLRKLILPIVFIALSFSSFAQSEYKKFRVDLGVGYAIPKGGGGLLFALEPKYAVLPNKLSVGLRFESAAMVKELSGSATTADLKLSSTVSYILTGDYHFTQSTARPFAGVGFGLYHNAAATFSSSSSELLLHLPGDPMT